MDLIAQGAVAGFGIALPLGPVGVLIVDTGLAAGWRRGVAAGLGASTMDLTYAAVAVLAGSTVRPLLGAHEHAVGSVASVVLAMIGGLLILAAVRPGERAGPGNADGSLARTWLTFTGLTAVNPLTALYFATVAMSVGGIDTTADAVAFAVAAGLASATWLSLVGATAGMLGHRLDDRARRATRLVGGMVVLALAVHAWPG